MILAVDIGNSDIVYGWHYDGAWQHQLRVPVENYVSAYGSLSQYVLEQGLAWARVEQMVISSVVPGITPTVRNGLIQLSGREPRQVSPALIESLNLGIENTAEIGSDLVANAVAGYACFGESCIVVDFGTALTFTVVSAQGHLQGVTIAPGLNTAMRALSSSTAQLPQVPLELPDSAIGSSTPHALQAGIMLGYVGLVKELIERMRAELGQSVKVVATGGLSRKLTPLADYFDRIDPCLTLEGLRLIALRTSQEGSGQ